MTRQHVGAGQDAGRVSGLSLRNGLQDVAEQAAARRRRIISPALFAPPTQTDRLQSISRCIPLVSFPRMTSTPIFPPVSVPLPLPFPLPVPGLIRVSLSRSPTGTHSAPIPMPVLDRPTLLLIPLSGADKAYLPTRPFRLSGPLGSVCQSSLLRI